MKMTTLVILFAVVVSPVGSSGMPQAWTTKRYHVLMDGNELYAICLAAERNTHILEDSIQFSTRVPDDLYASGKCLGYITAVVDSIPSGEGFSPETNVRLSQYADVVLRYLRDNPDKRQNHAYWIVRVAVTNAFPSQP